MYLAHLDSTAFPVDLPEAVAKDAVASSEPSRSKIYLQVVAVGYTLAPIRVAGASLVPRLRRDHQMGGSNWMFPEELGPL